MLKTTWKPPQVLANTQNIREAVQNASAATIFSPNLSLSSLFYAASDAEITQTLTFK